MERHVSPAEASHKHRLLGTKVRQAPCTRGQDAVVSVRREAGAIGQHELDVLLQDMRLDRSFDRGKRVIGSHDRNKVYGQERKA